MNNGKYDGWDNPLDWRWILLEKGINPDDCILIYDTSDNPIVYAIWNTRYLRVEYLYAEILSRRPGERTNINTRLARVVRDRGDSGDDCGHLVGAQHGGTMVFYNLIPQDRYINRGHKKTHGNFYWNVTDEIIKDAFDSSEEEEVEEVNDKEENSSIEIQYAPIYDNSISTTRPTYIHVLGRETIVTQNGTTKPVRLFENIIPNFKTKQKVKIRGKKIRNTETSIRFNWQSGQCNEENLKKYRRFDSDDDLDGEFDVNGEEKTNEHQNSNQNKNSKSNSSSSSSNNDSSNSGHSNNATRFQFREQTFGRTVTSCIPIVGAAVDLVDGIEDFAEGRVLQGITNVATGVGSAALDVLTFGVGSMAFNMFKGGAKKATTTAATVATKVIVGGAVCKGVGTTLARNAMK